MLGFAIIKDMSREDLIDEIIAGHRDKLEKLNTDQLKATVVNCRLDAVRASLIEESGLGKKVDSLGFLSGLEDD